MILHTDEIEIDLDNVIKKVGFVKLVVNGNSVKLLSVKSYVYLDSSGNKTVIPDRYIKIGTFENSQMAKYICRQIKMSLTSGCSRCSVVN
jgi:hypothetical protein